MTPQSVTHIANGATVAFTFPFAFFELLDIEVLVNGTVQSTGFSLVGAGSPEGGAVRFDAAPADGTQVVVRRTGRVQVSGSDSPGFLEAKVLAGANVTVTKIVDAAGEHLSVAADIDPAAFATAAQGAKADTAVQPGALGSAAFLDVGTGANQVVQLDVSGKLPLVDGSALTNLNASALTSGTVSPARLGNGTANASSFLRGDGAWVPMSSIGGGTSGAQMFTSSGTFTVPARTTASTTFKFTLVGGGGAGANNQAGAGIGTPGAAGGAAIKYLSGLTAGSTIIVTVGTAGTASLGANGGNGGNSSISSGTQTIVTVTAAGGSGGIFSTLATPFPIPPLNGGTTNADLTLLGSQTAYSQSYNLAPAGSSPFGSGGCYALAYAAQAGQGYGAGGSNSAGAAQAGGNGSPGFVLVEWSA